MSSVAGWGVSYIVLCGIALPTTLAFCCVLPHVPPTAATGSNAVPSRKSIFGRLFGPQSKRAAASPEITTQPSTCATSRRLCSSRAFVVLQLAVAFASLALQALQTFLPAVCVQLGLFVSEIEAAVGVGAGIVLGAIIGGVAHGALAECVTARLGVRSAAAEASVLFAIVAATGALGAVFCAFTDMAAAVRATLAVEALIVLTGAALLGSLGLQVRLPLLLSPVEARPLAVLLSTLSAYCGEFAGPVATGLLKDVLAPHCHTDDTTDRLDARCASAGDQHGLFLLLLAMSAVMLLDAFIWAVGAWVTRQAGTTREGGSAAELM